MVNYFCSFLVNFGIFFGYIGLTNNEVVMKTKEQKTVKTELVRKVRPAKAQVKPRSFDDALRYLGVKQNA